MRAIVAGDLHLLARPALFWHPASERCPLGYAHDRRHHLRTRAPLESTAPEGSEATSSGAVMVASRIALALTVLAATLIPASNAAGAVRTYTLAGVWVDVDLPTHVTAGESLFLLVELRSHDVRLPSGQPRLDMSAANPGLVVPGSGPFAGVWDIVTSIPIRAQTGRFMLRLIVEASFGRGGEIPFEVEFRPPHDVDSDGLPDRWEERLGLDPRSAAGDHGANGDPDGDGVSNAAQFAAHSHPRGQPVRYFAEGVSSGFFRTVLHYRNPDASAQPTVVVRALREDGALFSVEGPVINPSESGVRPLSTAHHFLTEVWRLRNSNYGLVVEASAPLHVERSTSWGNNADVGRHRSEGAAALQTTWHFAEGSTRTPFHLYYLVANPGTNTATVDVRYLMADGSPVERRYEVRPQSRVTIYTNADPALAGRDFGAVVQSSQPIVAERSMYIGTGSEYVAGHGTVGSDAAAAQWFFAEGASGTFFDTYLLLANPGATAATATVRYLLPDGQNVTTEHAVPAQRRITILADVEHAALATTAFSIIISSSAPVIAKRAMWWNSGTATVYSEGHVSSGLAQAGSRWVTDLFHLRSDYLLIGNVSATAAQIRISRLATGVSGEVISREREFALPPMSRLTLAGDMLDLGAITIVESLGSTPASIVVETSTYDERFVGGRLRWIAGSSVPAWREE